MSRLVGVFVIVLTLLPCTGIAFAECGAKAAPALEAAGTLALAGEFGAAVARARERAGDLDECPELAVAAWAWSGWRAGDAAAAKGGTDESLAGVKAALEWLGRVEAGVSDSAYAVAMLRAATAAAQDEREEMQVWLEQARDLSTKLALTGAAGRWPLPIDLAEGELWSSVDDFELAEASYTRALAERDSALAWRGLGRARDRRGNRTGACAAYRRALDTAGAVQPKGLVATEARGYVLVCR